MKQDKHTPGPWRKEWRNKKLFYIYSDDPNFEDDRFSPIVSSWGSNRHATQANADLIAAAPEMLEALEYWLHRDRLDIKQLEAATRAAINKAKGITE